MSETNLDSSRVKMTTLSDTEDPTALGSSATAEAMFNYITSQVRKLTDPTQPWNAAPSTSLEQLKLRQPQDVHKVFTYSGGNLTQLDVYTDNTETTLVYRKVFTYSLGVLNQEVYTRGAVTKTKTFSWTGNELTGINLT